MRIRTYGFPAVLRGQPEPRLATTHTNRPRRSRSSPWVSYGSHSTSQRRGCREPVTAQGNANELAVAGLSASAISGHRRPAAAPRRRPPSRGRRSAGSPRPRRGRGRPPTAGHALLQPGRLQPAPALPLKGGLSTCGALRGTSRQAPTGGAAEGSYRRPRRAHRIRRCPTTRTARPGGEVRTLGRRVAHTTSTRAWGAPARISRSRCARARGRASSRAP